VDGVGCKTLAINFISGGEKGGVGNGRGLGEQLEKKIMGPGKRSSLITNGTQ